MFHKDTARKISQSSMKTRVTLILPPDLGPDTSSRPEISRLLTLRYVDVDVMLTPKSKDGHDPFKEKAVITMFVVTESASSHPWYRGSTFAPTRCQGGLLPRRTRK